MLERIKNSLVNNQTLQEMLISIPLYGVIFQLSVVWLVKDKFGYSVGLWIGIVMAACMMIHMTVSLEYALDHSEKDASKLITTHNIIRYLFVIVICGLIMISKVINPLATFLGIMSLKVSAYLQPFTHKLIRR